MSSEWLLKEKKRRQWLRTSFQASPGYVSTYADACVVPVFLRKLSAVQPQWKGRPGQLRQWISHHLHRHNQNPSNTMTKRAVMSKLRVTSAAELKWKTERRAEGFYMCDYVVTCHPIWFFVLSRTPISFSNMTATSNTPPGHVGAIWTIRRVVECCVRWSGPHNHVT